LRIRLPWGRKPHDVISISLLAWKATSAVLTVVTLVFSYLTAAAELQSAKCAGQTWLLGHRAGISDSFGLGIVSFIAAVGFIIVVRSSRVKQTIAQNDWEVLRLGPIRVSSGVFLIFSVLVGGLVSFGSMTWVTVKRYDAIASYCQSAMGVEFEGGSGTPAAASFEARHSASKTRVNALMARTSG
jgi:hypothetical protein